MVDVECNDSEWDTVSEEEVELTLPCPPVKQDVSKLTEVPLSIMVKAKSMSWLSHVITFAHPNQAYRQIMVSSKTIFVINDLLVLLVAVLLDVSFGPLFPSRFR